MNKTIEDGLRPYAIGEKLRALRLKKKLGLVQLGKHTGLSPALLSKLERNKLHPTLPTLLRIAMVFSVGLDYFFTDESRRHVIAVSRKAERMQFPEKPGNLDAAYFFECLDFVATERKFNTYFAEFRPVPAEKAKPHQHPSVEFVLVLDGTLQMKIGTEDVRLEEGDALYFDSTVPHGYQMAGRKNCRAVVVTAA
jgi:transcriptional regulator with XRE-family HTH domain